MSVALGFVSHGPKGPRTTRFRWDGLQVDRGRTTHHLALPGESVHAVLWRREARAQPSRVRLHLQPYDHRAGPVPPLDVEIPAGRREVTAPIGDHLGLAAQGVACVQLRLEVEADGKREEPVNVTLMRGLGPPASPWVPGVNPRELRTPWLSLLRAACTIADGAAGPLEAATALAERIWRGLPYGGHPVLTYRRSGARGREAAELSWACDVFLDEPHRPEGAELSRFWDLDRLSMALTGRLDAGALLEVDCGDCSLVLVALLACLGVDASTARLCHADGDGYGVSLPPHLLPRGAAGEGVYHHHEVVLLPSGEVVDPTARPQGDPGSVPVYPSLAECMQRLGTQTPLQLQFTYAGPAPVHPRERRRLRRGQGCEDAKAVASVVLPTLTREALECLPALGDARRPRIAAACSPLGADRFEVAVHAWGPGSGTDAVARTIVDGRGRPLPEAEMEAALRRQARLYASSDVGYNPHRRTVERDRCPLTLSAWGDAPADEVGARLDRVRPRR